MESKYIPSLTIRDVLDFAVTIEQKSEYLYDGLAKIINFQETRDIFITFANEESGHKKKFKEMLLGFGKKIYESNSASENIEYLNNYIKDSLFNKEILEDKISKIKDPGSVFEFITSMELDCILYYNEITKLMIENDKIFIPNIIDEERRHFIRVMQIKRQRNY